MIPMVLALLLPSLPQKSPASPPSSCSSLMGDEADLMSPVVLALALDPPLLSPKTASPAPRPHSPCCPPSPSPTPSPPSCSLLSSSSPSLFIVTLTLTPPTKISLASMYALMTLVNLFSVSLFKLYVLAKVRARFRGLSKSQIPMRPFLPLLSLTSMKSLVSRLVFSLSPVRKLKGFTPSASYFSFAAFQVLSVYPPFSWKALALLRCWLAFFCREISFSKFLGTRPFFSWSTSVSLPQLALPSGLS
mmetsp:Transcript_22072/g.41501  ORF Transcript_22072/g.41501 Transcript_22072/m.41501 type:complete len:247 (-) Transcript_22072:671-1411(-)